MKKLSFLIATLFSLSTMTYASETNVPLKHQLKKLVEISSSAEDTTGVGKIQNWIKAELKQIGFSVEDRSDLLIVAKLPGVKTDAKIITVLVHADTVFDKKSDFKGFKESDDGKMAYGPGVIDDKGGIVIAIEGLRRFLKSHKLNYTLQFVSSPSEEIGSPGFTDRFKELAKTSWMILNFEPTLEDGSLVHTRRGNRWYQITVTGKEAHSGRSHKEGINACHALASALSEISKFTNYKNDVTVSIGRMEGGKDKFNIVCGQAQAKVDTRFSSILERDKLHQKIEKVLKNLTVKGAQATYELVDDCPPFSVTPRTTPYLNKYIDVVKKIEGINISSGKSGGTADSNYFSTNESIILDGLGPIGGKMHTPEEFIVLSSLDTRSEAFNLFLQLLNRESK